MGNWSAAAGRPGRGLWIILAVAVAAVAGTGAGEKARDEVVRPLEDEAAGERGDWVRLTPEPAGRKGVPPGDSNPDTPSLAAGMRRRATYTGMDYCLICHTNKAGVLDTLHPKKIRSASAVLTTQVGDSTVSIFDPSTAGYSTYVAPWSTYFNRGNVEFTIGGSGWKQRFMTRAVPAVVDGTDYSGVITLPEGEYVIMGIQWNIAERRWEDYHGPLGDNDWFMAEGRGDPTSASREWGRNCGNCHVSGYDFDTRSWPDMDRPGVEKGVSCESCHGPGSRHPGKNPLRTIVNPIRLSAKRRLETCGQCHGRGMSQGGCGTRGYFGYPHNDPKDKEYRPGRPLKRFYVQDNPEDQASSFWGNGVSKKNRQQYLDYLKSPHAKVGVDCVTCHASHGDGEGESQTRLPGNVLCARCHSEQGGSQADLAFHTKHPADFDPTPGCVNCHMPHTATSINAYDIRAHVFRIIEPQETIDYGVPHACYDCHGPDGEVFELDDSFLQQVIDVWDQIGHVYDAYDIIEYSTEAATSGTSAADRHPDGKGDLTRRSR